MMSKYTDMHAPKATKVKVLTQSGKENIKENLQGNIYKIKFSSQKKRKKDISECAKS